MKSNAKSKPIQENQIKAIWANARSASLQRDEVYDIIYKVAGKESVKELTYDEAGWVISDIKRNISYTYKKEIRPKDAITKGQEGKIWSLMYKLQEKSPSNVSLGVRLKGIIKKEISLDVSVKKPFAWITHAEANKLIEILKNYVENVKS